jgi:hypothetical protein
MNQQVRLGDLLGTSAEEDFRNFDLTEVQKILKHLQNIDPIDLAHAESLQQQALRGADILAEFLAKIVKTVSYLEARVNSIKNKVSLEYVAPDGSRTTTDMKIWAGNASSEVELISISLSEAKASKIVLEKKFDIMIRTHHHYKDIAQGLRRTVLGYTRDPDSSEEKAPEGWA